MRHILCVIALLASAATAAAQYDSPFFDGLVSPYGSSLYPVSLALVDLDGDGQKDAILGRDTVPGALVMLGEPHGGFAPPQEFASSFPLRVLATGDVDGDGDEDVTGVSDYGPFNTLLNLGDGTLGFAQSAQPSQSISGIALADMDGDGVLDAVLSVGAIGGLVLVAHGLGTGQFSGPTFHGPFGYANDLRVADLDGDGALDPVVAKSTGAVAYMLGDGAGDFGGLRFVPVGDEPLAVEVVDLLEDGAPDLVASVHPVGTSFPAQVLATALNQGGGVFEDAQLQSLPFSIRRFRTGDVVGGDAQDLVTVSDSHSVVAVFEGDGAGGLSVVRTLATERYGRDLALDDRDGNGQLDLVVAGRSLLLELRSQGGAPDGPRCYVLPGESAARPALGDLDGDGHDDAVAASTNSDQVHVLLGDGTGALGAPSSYDAGASPADAALGDLDGDGDLDVVCGLAFPARIVRLLNDGQGVLGPWASYVSGAGGGALSLHLGDFGQDGRPDAAACTGQGKVLVFLADGAGGFEHGQAIDVAGSAQALDLAPLDTDSHLDIVVTGGTSTSVLHGVSDGTFGAPQAVVTAHGANQTDIVAGRFDEDDTWDLATAGFQGSDLWMTLADGAGGWLAPVAWATVDQPGQLEAADLDGDGRLDVTVVPESNGDFVVVHLGAGGGALGPPHSFVAGFEALVAVPHDLDGDGLPELVIAVDDSHQLTVLRNHGPSAWTALGSGLAGVHGVPQLDGSGSLQAGAATSLALSQAAGSAPCVLVAGAVASPVPFKGGTLVPAPQLLLPVVTDVFGQIELSGAWPTGLPAGTTLFLQAWLPDAAGPKGWAASDAVQAETP